MKKIILFFLSLLFTNCGYCCVTCNKQLQQAIFDSTFYPNLLSMLSAFIALAIIVAVLARLATRIYKRRLASTPGLKERAAAPLAAASVVLGIGLGGFVDGIVLHQVLQWHEMLTNKIPADNLLNKSVNMFWDGIFHSFTFLTTCVGIYLMWKLLPKKNINRSGHLLVGGILGGWGLFNLVEGIIDHQLLRLHNVRELSPNHDAWNYGFLGFGLMLLTIGYLLMKSGQRVAMRRIIKH